MHPQSERLFDTDTKLGVSDVNNVSPKINTMIPFSELDHSEQKKLLKTFLDEHVDYLDLAVYTIETQREDAQEQERSSFNADEVHSLAWEVAEHWIDTNINLIGIAARMESNKQQVFRILQKHVENKLHSEINVVMQNGRRWTDNKLSFFCGSSRYSEDQLYGDLHRKSTISVPCGLYP